MHYVIDIRSLFRIEAESEEDAHEELRQRLRDGEYHDPTDVELMTVDVEE